MNVATDAWVLHAGPAPNGSPEPERGVLRRELFTLPELADNEALVEPLMGSWEANIAHAVARQPIDVCRARNEDRVVLGNLGLVRVLRGARCGPTPGEGEICMVMPFAKRDRYGYAELVYAYDGPGTIGIMAKHTKIQADLLLPVPSDGHDLARWAAYARYFTAWDNWRVAYQCWLTQMTGQDPSDALVFGWGGGVVYAEALLARRAGFRVAMTASTDARLAQLRANGIIAVDRRLFPDLQYDPYAAQCDSEYLRRYRGAEADFLDLIAALSDGAGAAIFIDNIGAPLYKATVKALARQGVLTTVGWRQGMRISSVRASECIRRHLHVNTHVWRYDDSPRIRDYQLSTGWLPEIDADAIYDFDSLPQLAEDYHAGKLDTYFPLFRINDI